MRIAMILAVMWLASLADVHQVSAFECKVCHSKNPRMVAMHKALEGQNCFECHKIGEKLMGKSQPKDVNNLLKRRVNAVECLPCHGRKE